MPLDAPQGTWVKLYLEPQGPASNMPEHVIGYLQQETANAYMLARTVSYKENDDFEMEPVEDPSILFVNRTYVWGCEILGDSPYKDTQTYTSGGLG